MTTRLAPLRTRLADLRRRRWRLRVGSAAAMTGLILAWSFVLLFFVDWLFEFNRLQRLILLCGIAGVAVWCWKRILAPALAIVETDLDMALVVERQQAIDSDLVAALQFESFEARRWGSISLKEAVIEYVAEFANEMDVFQGLDTAQFRRRLRAAGATLFVLLVAGALFPRHFGTFVNRMFLGAAHYPTRTVIERIVLNGTEVLPSSGRQVPFRTPFGRALRAEIHLSGRIPESGRLRLTGVRNGLQTAVELTAGARNQKGSPDLAGTAPEGTVFTGALSRLTDGATYQIFLGDAWTDPAAIEVIPLPVVAVELDHVPPAYAAQAAAPVAQRGTLQISVIEGSDVSIRVVCRNKPLKSATLLVAMNEYPLVPADDTRMTWKLPSGASPLSRVVQPVSFEVRVVDDDELAPEQPLKGHIHLLADRPPRVAAGVVTAQVLPAAKPSLAYGATDDYGIADLRLRRQIVRLGGGIDEGVSTIESATGNQSPPTAMSGRHVIDLKPLALVKGDEVRLTLEALDYRGERLGSIGQSETLILRVTDESGILAGLVETDEKSARQLDQIIQRQLGIGDAR